MNDKESIYDEQISPLMLKILDICKQEGISMFASFEYAENKFCTSAISTGHPVIEHYRALAQCGEDSGVNIDKYMNWVAKGARERGHSSMYLQMAGIPLVPER